MLYLNQRRIQILVAAAIFFSQGLVIGLGSLSVTREIFFAVDQGTRRVALEVQNEISGEWETRRILHLPGRAAQVKLEIPQEDVRRFRVLTSRTDSFPYAFFKNRKAFGYGGKAEWEATYKIQTANRGGLYSALTPQENPIVVDDAGTEQLTDDEGASTEAVESDIWKVEGNTLYFFNQYRGLQIYDLTTPWKPARIAYLRMPALGEDMYVLDDSRVVLLLRQPRLSSGFTPEDEVLPANSEVLVVHWSDGEARVESRTSLPGQILESRMVGRRLYAVSNSGAWRWNDWGWRWSWPLAQSASLTVADDNDTKTPFLAEAYLNTLDLTFPASPVMVEERALPTRAKVVSASSTHFMVVRNQEYTNYYSAQDLVDVFRIHTASPPELLGTVKVGGLVNDKFKMQVLDGILTVVSQCYRKLNWWQRYTRIETFGLPSGGSFTQQAMNSLDIAENETLHATRFDDKRLYVVTFRQIDPLFVIDLADPADLKVSGELEIPGWSTYLIPRGDRLLSVGVEDSRVAISIFDVSDPAKPGMLDRVFIGEHGQYTSSEANWDEKAVGYLPGQDVLIVPYETRDWNQETGQYTYRTAMQQIRIAGDDLQKQGEVPHEVKARRSTLIGSHLVSISGQELLVADVSDAKNPTIRANHALSWPVHRVFKTGEFLLELESPGNAGGASVARLVKASDPETLIQELTLPVGLLEDTVWLADSSRLVFLLNRDEPGSYYYTLSKRPDSIQGLEGERALCLGILDLHVPGEMTLLPATEVDLNTDFWGFQGVEFFREGEDWLGIIIHGNPPLESVVDQYGYRSFQYRHSSLLLAIQPLLDGTFTILSRTWQFARSSYRTWGYQTPVFAGDRWFFGAHSEDVNVLDVFDFQVPSNPVLVGRPEIPEGVHPVAAGKASEDGAVLYFVDQGQGFYAEPFMADAIYPSKPSSTLYAACFDGQALYFLPDSLQGLAVEQIAWTKKDFFATREPRYAWFGDGNTMEQRSVGQTGRSNVWRYNLNEQGKFEILGQWYFPGANGETLRVEGNRLFQQNQYFLQWTNVDETDAVPEWTQIPQGVSHSMSLRDAFYSLGEGFWYPVAGYGVELLRVQKSDGDHLPGFTESQVLSSGNWERMAPLNIQLLASGSSLGPAMEDGTDWSFKAPRVFLESAAATAIEGYAGAWYSLEGYGSYYTEYYPWIYHDDLGWLYVHNTGSLEGFWSWRAHGGQGWLWTSKDLYPFCYSANTDSWLLFHELSDIGLWRYDYGSRTWSKD